MSEPTVHDVNALLDAALAQVGDVDDVAYAESWDIDKHGLTHTFRCVYTLHDRWYDAHMIVGANGELPPLSLIVTRMTEHLAAVVAPGA